MAHSIRRRTKFYSVTTSIASTLLFLLAFAPQHWAKPWSSSLQRQISKERLRVRTERNAVRNEHHRRLRNSSSSWTASLSERRVAIECETAPLFKCPKCYNQLVEEQRSVVLAIQEQFPHAILLDSTYKLLNMLFVVFQSTPDDESDEEEVLHRFILGIPGVANVSPSEEYTLLDFLPAIDAFNVTALTNGTDSLFSKPLRDIGVDVASQVYCASGQGIRIAVCDGGVDYTHTAMGGMGTVDAFAAAYGADIDDDLNRQRDGLFPTGSVTDGYDFLGDMFRDGDPSFAATEDDDPIDLAGHGTAVAHAIRAVAPDVEIIAVKICTTTGSTCPDFSFVRGMEYILDPNQDGDMSDAVDIVNLSLGRLYASNYYSVLARAAEEILNFGVLPILAAGNNGNFPFILGGAPATPNALTVGATVVLDNGAGNASSTLPRTMAHYSSRGPGESNLIKPDLVAPGGPYGLAKASTGNLYGSFEGTSFAAPLVAGAAALLMQKCPECSPFAIKTILVNHATHNVRYSLTSNSTTIAPVTLQGGGELQVHRSLAATFWAYCTDNHNPSISLGLINAARNTTIIRTIRIVQLTKATTEIISLGYQFRANSNTTAGVAIRFLSQTTVHMDGQCGTEYLIQVEFEIDASRAPSNHMSSGGSAGNDPGTLDANEVDGWILLTADTMNQEVSIPFHMILRKSAEVTIQTSTFNTETLDSTKLPVNLTVGLRNSGAETAQLDIFQLLYIGDDAPESGYGINSPPADLRYVGYRVVPLRAPGCQDLIEIAVVTWESQSTISYTHYNAWIDVDFDGTSEHTVFNSGYRLGSAQNEMRRISLLDGIEYCVKYPPDHGTNTANTVIRFCTDDVGISQRQGLISLAVTSYSFPEITVVDVMEYRNITIPVAELSAPSFDLRSRSVLDEITVSGVGSSAWPDVPESLGLLLVTNSYRSFTSTGSSTRASEAIVITREGTAIPLENTPDTLVYPVPTNVVGPSCAWETTLTSCFGRQLERLVAQSAKTSIASIHDGDHEDLFDLRNLQAKTECPEFPLLRVNVTVIERSPTFSQTSLPPVSPVNLGVDAPTVGSPFSFSTDDSKSAGSKTRGNLSMLCLLGAVFLFCT